MPMYEYDCPVCGVVEVIQKFSDAALEKCPQCVEAGVDSPVERMISASAFHLKGGGWYKTDYASSGGRSTSASESSKKTGSGDGAITGGESAPSSASSDSTTSAPKASGCGSSCGCH
jgi:putative FmdB family regulatory protein